MVTTRIDIDKVEGRTRPEIRVDGQEQPEGYPIRWRDIEGLPFTGVYVDGQRQYDLEIWIDGNLRHRVPAQSARADLVYDAIESWQHPQQPLARPPFDEGAVPSLDSLRDEIREHPGQEAFLRWEGLHRSVDVHDGNAKELGSLLAVISNSEDIAIEMFQNTRPPDARREIEARIDQRLHNYVSSSSSLIDHTRRLFNDYKGSELAREFETRKQVVAASAPAAFVRDLRNYTTHRELPFIGHTVSFGEQMQSVATEIELSAQELLKWDGWKQQSREFLLSASEPIRLREVVREHVRVVRDLYTWVLQQFEPLHRQELADLGELRDEFNWVLSGGKEGWPRNHE